MTIAIQEQLANLIKQQEETQALIEQLQTTTRFYSEFEKRVQALAKDLGINYEDFKTYLTGTTESTPTKLKATKGTGTRGPAPIKYRTKEGKTWTGRGRQPLFISDYVAAGGALEDLKV